MDQIGRMGVAGGSLRVRGPFVQHGAGGHNTQVGAAVTGGQAATALVLILLALAFLRLHFAAKDREERVHSSQKNTVQAGKRKAE